MKKLPLFYDEENKSHVLFIDEKENPLLIDEKSNSCVIDRKNLCLLMKRNACLWMENKIPCFIYRWKCMSVFIDEQYPVFNEIAPVSSIL